MQINRFGYYWLDTWVLANVIQLATQDFCALALDRYTSSDDSDAVAIAIALHLYLSESAHDYEPGFITIRRDLPSSWGDKSLLVNKQKTIR